MKSITTVVLIAALAACAMAMAPQSSRSMATTGSQADAAATYEHLATAIIAIRETEDSLVHSMLMEYAASARSHLERAAEATSSARTRLLEAAATDITNLANEGDKRIQAVRQRLLKAGHHHHTDETTQEDYMFIDSAEKKELLALARSVAQMLGASSDEIRSAAERVAGVADKALKAE